jgi:broad specificity phosphatase PhoE
MRHTESESPESVLAKLRDAEPIWKPHPKAATHPAAKNLSVTNETRESFRARYAAWLAAVEREEKRKVDGPPKEGKGKA